MDEQLVRAYRNSGGERVQLYVGYYQHQAEGRELAGEAGHALHEIARPLTIRADAREIKVNEIVQKQKTGAHRGLLYWYDVNGRALGSIYAAKRYSMWDALTRRRTNGAVVIIGWVSPVDRPFENLRRDAIAFAEALIPVLRKQLPS